MTNSVRILLVNCPKKTLKLLVYRHSFDVVVDRDNGNNRYALDLSVLVENYVCMC